MIEIHRLPVGRQDASLLKMTQGGLFMNNMASFIHQFTLFSELNADCETGNLKLGNASTSLYFSNFTAKTQDQ